jgi:hypothetical protein
MVLKRMVMAGALWWRIGHGVGAGLLGEGLERKSFLPFGGKKIAAESPTRRGTPQKKSKKFGAGKKLVGTKNHDNCGRQVTG